MQRSVTGACDLCPYQITTATERDTAAALFAHLRTVHPTEIGAPP